MKEWFERMPSFPLAVLLAMASIVIGVSIYENVATGLITAVVLLIGLWGSYVLGRSSVTGGDVRPRLRGNYRRMLTLHGQLYALTQLIARQRGVLARSPDSDQRAISTLEMIEFIVGQNLSPVADAMEDWADILPEEVADLRDEAEERGREIAELQEELEELTDGD